MYKYLLFDLDDTILDFKAAEEAAISNLLSHHGLTPTVERLAQYAHINLTLWEQLERKQVTIEHVLHHRFELFFRDLGLNVHGAEAEQIFRAELNRQGVLIPEAQSLLTRWRDDFRIYAISNGLYQTQILRLEKAGITDLFQDLFISEQIGVNKPDPRFFDHVKTSIPGFDSRKALVIGDSLTSDILGGNQAGIATCWFNRHGKPFPDVPELVPTFEIQRLDQLDEIIRS